MLNKAFKLSNIYFSGPILRHCLPDITSWLRFEIWNRKRAER